MPATAVPRLAAVHEAVYRERGFRLIEVPVGPVPTRVAVVAAVMAAAAT